MTPEQRRDDTVARIIAAGGIVRATMPLARTDDPHTVAAHRILAGSPTATVRDAVEAVRDDTETDLTGLVPWTPEEEVDHSEGSGHGS